MSVSVGGYLHTGGTCCEESELNSSIRMSVLLDSGQCDQLPPLLQLLMSPP